jgi:hypothetical protein
MYSNVGFNLLELLIEEVAGREFAEYMADEVLIPLGMQRSSFGWKEAFGRTVATGYELQGDPVPPYVYAAKASGGLFSDAADLARFVAAGMTGTRHKDHGVLGEESIRMLHTPQVDISGMFGIVADLYGLGHFIEMLSDGREAVWHGGQGHGWMTHFHSVPETGDGIVIITNSERSWPFFADVLNAWAGWCGFGPIGFGSITYATTALRVLIGIVLLITLWQVYRLVSGVRIGRRNFKPLSVNSLAVRLLQAILGLGGIAVLAWSAAQPYLFVSSIFPGTIAWAGLACLVLAITMVASALLPPVGDRK